MEPAELYGIAPEWEMTLERCLRRFQYRALDQALWQLAQLQLVRSVPVAAPAAGAEWSVPVPPGEIWELLSVRYLFTTSAVVANRQPSLAALDGDGAQLWRVATSANVVASSSPQVIYLAGYGYTGAAGPVMGGLPSPPATLIAGWQLRSLTGSFDAGDQYSQIMLTVRQWSPGDLINRLRVLMEDLGSTPLLNSLIGA